MTDYVAKVPLFIGLTRVRKAGDLIPAEQVERFGWKDKVEPVKKAQQHTGDEEPTAATKRRPRKKA